MLDFEIWKTAMIYRGIAVLGVIIVGIWFLLGLYDIFGWIPSILIQLLTFSLIYYLIIRYYNNKRRKEKIEIQKIEDDILRKQLKKK